MAVRYELSEADYTRFRRLVRSKSGLEIPLERRPDLERVVARMVAEMGLPDTDALYHLAADGEAGRPSLDRFIAALTVGETHFFRNQPQFEALERHILPDLIARQRTTRCLRIWSAGCATGEEPYSLAILVERLLPDIADWNVLILGTDINPEALEKARRGIYGPWSFREVPPEIEARYFIRRGRESEVVPRVRDMVTFAYLNLVDDVYPSLLTNTNAMNLILCRNVTIYFDQETTRQVVGCLYESLDDGGWLVVGHAEPSQSIFQRFVLRNFPGTVVYQKRSGERKEAVAEHTSFSTASNTPRTPLPPAERIARSAPEATSRARAETGPRQVSTRQVSTRQVSTRAQTERLYAEALELSRAGHSTEALNRLDELARANRADARAPFLAAKIEANRLQLTAAQRWIEMALQREPLMAAAHYLHAMILQEQGQLTAALTAARRCVYADPHFLIGHYVLADLSAKLGQRERAQKALENLSRLLVGRERDDIVPEGDGLTIGRLLELVAVQKETW